MTSRHHALLLLSLMTLTVMCSASCSRSAATSCIFNEDCAEPYEYCSAATDLCTVYECLEDDDCTKSERCSLITNTCIERPKLDMAPALDMTPDMMLLRDMTPDMTVLPDLGPPDLGPPDLGLMEMGPPPDRTRPEIVSISPEPGSAVDLSDDLSDTFTVTFSEPIDAISLSPFSISLRDDTDNAIGLEITYDEAAMQAVITTTSTSMGSMRHQLVLDEVIRDKAGNKLERSRTVLFYAPLPRDEADHALATKWAPIIHQELATTLDNHWRRDVPSVVDFDGDWKAANNLENLAGIMPGEYRASVYYHVVSTPSHHFITYMLYYPVRTLVDDMMQEVQREHDFTGAMLVVERTSDELLIVEGLRLQSSTDLIIAFMNRDRDVNLPGQGRIRGEFGATDLVDGTHYPLYVPAQRHEACNWDEAEVLPPFDVCVHSSRAFREGFTGVTMTIAEEGQGLEQATQSAPDQPYAMSYALVPFEETFWLRRDFIGANSLFGRGFAYSPEGGRPAGSMPDEALYIPRSLASEDPDSFGKSPFQWLTQPARRNDGQWLIDPTWTVRQRYNVPETPDWSYEYCYNLPLAIDRRSEEVCMTSTPSTP